jgi:hypothetical protein
VQIATTAIRSACLMCSLLTVSGTRHGIRRNNVRRVSRASTVSHLGRLWCVNCHVNSHHVRACMHNAPVAHNFQTAFSAFGASELVAHAVHLLHGRMCAVASVATCSGRDERILLRRRQPSSWTRRAFHGVHGGDAFLCGARTLASTSDTAACMTRIGDESTRRVAGTRPSGRRHCLNDVTVTQTMYTTCSFMYTSL